MACVKFRGESEQQDALGQTGHHALEPSGRMEKGGFMDAPGGLVSREAHRTAQHPGWDVLPRGRGQQPQHRAVDICDATGLMPWLTHLD